MSCMNGPDFTGLAPATAAIDEDSAWQQLRAAAAEPYRRAGRFAWHFARGKLGRDPVFRALVERGDLSQQARVLDIGCGQGLLASLLAAAGAQQAKGRWPLSWPMAPGAVHYTGIELMPRDIARAQASLRGLQPLPRFACADMREAALPSCDAVVILDVLHYVDHASQEHVLGRVREALRAGGSARARLLLRVGDAADRRGYAVSQWVDRWVTRVRGHGAAPTWGRRLDDWIALLVRLGFAVQALPMSRGTPFANVLLVAELRP